MSLNLSQRRSLSRTLALVAIGQLTLVEYLNITTGAGLSLLGSIIVALILFGFGFKLLDKPS